MSEQAHKKALSREEIAAIEVGHTDIDAAAKWTLIIVFLVCICAVPIAQQAIDSASGSGGKHSLAMFRHVADAAEYVAVTRRGSPVGRVFHANADLLHDINDYERGLEDSSVLTGILLPPSQQILAGVLGVGNEQCYLGRSGWLFYRPGIDYVLGPAFLSRQELKKRSRAGSEWQKPPQPDPRKAIIDFKEQCARRGIALLVVPAPVKAMIHPERFSSRYDDWQGVLQNPSYKQFIADLEHAGVLVFDPGPMLVEARETSGEDQFMENDTHWTPRAMELVAGKLAAFVRNTVKLPARPPVRFKRVSETVSNLGDLGLMLKLPESQQLYREQSVIIHTVLTANNLTWKANRSADILFLGDSFSNIYSLQAMGWGHSAGLPEQLSFELQRPVDRIVINNDGAYVTREKLSRELASGSDRLAGKRLVIWEFATRELLVGNWKMIEMRLGEARETDFLALEKGQTRVISGEIRSMGSAPRPGSVPYKDHIIGMHLTGIEEAGKPLEKPDVLVYTMSMRNRVWTDVVNYRIGQRITMRLSSWIEVEDQYGGINQDLIDEEALDYPEPVWGEEIKK